MIRTEQFLRDAGRKPPLEPDHIADNAYPIYHDHQAEVLQSGLFYTNYLSIGQRRGATNFNASFQNTHTEGVIVGLKGFGRQNFRLNVDQQLTPRLDLEISTFYGRSTNTPVNDPRAAGRAGSFARSSRSRSVPTSASATNPDGSPTGQDSGQPPQRNTQTRSTTSPTKSGPTTAAGSPAAAGCGGGCSTGLPPRGTTTSTRSARLLGPGAVRVPDLDRQCDRRHPEQARLHRPDLQRGRHADRLGQLERHHQHHQGQLRLRGSDLQSASMPSPTS